MYAWPRKPDLEALGVKMGLKVSKFKLKSRLIAAIQQDIRYARYVECYNDVDPVTLECLHKIDDERYIQWSQHDLVFGADSSSIRQLFAHKLFTLPFSLEIKTWKPDCDFDLRNVNALSSYNVPSMGCEVRIVPTTNNFTSWILNEIDILCGRDSGYIYGHVKNLLVDEMNVKRVHTRVKRALLSTMDSLLSSSNESNDWTCDALYSVVLSFASLRSLSSSQLLLIEFIKLLGNFKNTIGPQADYIIFLIFNDIR